MNAAGEAESGAVRLRFDQSVQLAFRGSWLSSDGGLLLHRDLDDALGLTDMAAALLADPRTGRNGRHRLAGLLRRSGFSRLKARPAHPKRDAEAQARFQKRGLCASLSAARVAHPGKCFQLWFEDEARVGNKGRLCHR